MAIAGLAEVTVLDMHCERERKQCFCRSTVLKESTWLCFSPGLCKRGQWEKLIVLTQVVTTILRVFFLFESDHMLSLFCLFKHLQYVIFIYFHKGLLHRESQCHHVEVSHLQFKGVEETSQ